MVKRAAPRSLLTGGVTGRDVGKSNDEAGGTKRRPSRSGRASACSIVHFCYCTYRCELVITFAGQFQSSAALSFQYLALSSLHSTSSRSSASGAQRCSASMA